MPAISKNNINNFILKYFIVLSDKFNLTFYLF